MIILGIDPGPTTCGVAWIDLDRYDARLIDKGKIDSTPDAIVGAIGKHGPLLVLALEQPAGYAYSLERSRDLIETARVGGVIAGIAGSLRIEIDTATASEWRRAIVGKGNASDKLIGQVIPRQIKGWPSRSNNHERDAAGVALFIGRRSFWRGTVRKAVGT